MSFARRQVGFIAVFGLALVLLVRTAEAAIGIDQTIWKDQGTASTTVATAPFSTTSGNELLLAFVGSDYQSGQSTQNVTVTGITGGGLTWVLVRRTNTQRGTAEIWRAFAPSTLTNITVTATLSQSVQSSITIMTFTGVDPTGTNGSGAIGAVASGSASSGAPTATLVTTRDNSRVVAAGNDYDNAISRTPATGQTLVHQYLSPVNDTYWVQRQTNPTPLSGTSVTINDTAPTGDRYNLSVVEILSLNQTAGPDLTVTKTHSGNFVQGQSGAVYTITVTNAGVAATSGTVSVTDALPASLTATAIGGTGWSCTLSTLTCTQSSILAAGASYPTITLTTNVAGNAPASVTNTATVSGGGETNTGNDTANDVTTINVNAPPPDLTIVKSHSGNFVQGQTGAAYTISVRNSGGSATSGTVTMTDSLPAGLTQTAISGFGWSCTLSTLTCTRTSTLAAGASYPAITLTTSVAANAPASVTNTATVSGGGETNTANDTASDVTTIAASAPPDLTIIKSHAGNFTQGQTGAAYTIAVTNSGGAPTSGTVTVTDTLPASLTRTAITGTGWTCTLSTLTCTRGTALAAGASYPAITVTVNVAANAPASVTNTATVSGGGETNTANDTANDVTTIAVNAVPDLTVAKSHSGTFVRGQTGAAYSIVVSNSGAGTTSGTVSVTDTLPASLTATAMAGTGWVCGVTTLTCTRSDALAAGASYPVITLTVNVAATAPATVTNSATVSGGGESNLSNDTATDTASVTGGSVITHVGGASAHPVVTNQTMTLNYTPAGTSNAVVVLIGCRSAGVTGISLTAPGWTFTPISGLVGPSGYADFISTFGAIVPSTAPVTFRVTLSGGNGDCSGSDTTVMVDEFAGNDVTGGTVTFDAHNESLDPLASGICTGAPVTPANNNDAIWYGCFDNVTAVTNGYTKGQDDGTGDWTEYKILSGGLGVQQMPGFNTNPQFFSFALAGVAIKPAAGAAAPDLTISKTHSGNFTQGQTGATYTIAVTNSGGSVTSGTVTVTDTLPAGLTATAMAGTNWACTVGTRTCTRTDALAAGASYPPIVLTVNVAATAPSSVTNTATVSGGGEGNTANDAASDPTSIAAMTPPNIRLVQQNVNGNEGGTSTMSVSFTSSNTQGDFLIVTGSAARPATTLSVVDTLGNSYLTAVGPVTDPAQDVTIYIWYVPICKGGANTVTITPSRTAALEIHVSEWTGLSNSAPVDQTAWATGTGTGVSSGAKTTTTDGELIFGYGWVFNTASAGAGFTPVNLINGDLAEYQVQTAAGSVAATFTQASGTWFALMATFKSASASASGSIAGTLGPAATGGSNATLLLSGAATGTTTADANGNYAFAGLAPGTYTVTPAHSGFSFSPPSQTVAVNNGALTGLNFMANVETDWLMVDHDPGRSGTAPDEKSITPANVSGLQLKWWASVTGSVTAQPLYVHGIPIAGQTRDVVVVATGGNSIYVFDANTGSTLWTRNFGPPTPNTWGLPDGFGIEAPPVIDRVAGRIYTVSTDGNFRTISLADGTDVVAAIPLIANPVTNKVWGGLNRVGNSIYVASASNGGDVAPWRGQVYQIDVSAAPTVVRNFVVVPSIAAPNGGGGIWGYGGVSADLATGNVFATTSFDSTVDSHGNEGTALYSNSVVALDSQLNLRGYYQAPTPSSIACGGSPCDLDFASTVTVFQPAGCPTMVTAGSKNGNLYLFRAADFAGSIAALQTLTLNASHDSLGSGGVGGVPAYSPATNMVYITDAGPGVPGIAAGLVALRVTSSCTLQVAWSNPLGGGDMPNSTPTIANGIVFVGEGNTGLIHAYDAQTGAHLWQSGSSYGAAATFAAPIVAGGNVYAGSWSRLSGGGIVGAFTLPSTAVLTVSPQSLSFTTATGSNPAPATINVTNGGGGALNFTAASDSPAWLSVSPASGTAPRALQVSVAASGLSAGTYGGHITVASTGTQGSPAVVPVTLSVGSTSNALAIDASTFRDNNTASSTIVTPQFSTASPNELLLAFIGSDFQPSQGGSVTVTGITGGGLTWVLVKRTNAQSGTAEIWRAFASTPLTNIAVTATLSQSVQSSMTVLTFSGVDTTGTNGSGAIGAVGGASATSGAPTATLTTTRNKSWVVAAGNDYDNAIARTVGAGQTLVHQYLSPINDTYWVQRQAAPTPLSGTNVTINDTAPTADRYNLAICEVLPAVTANSQTWSITGTITPAASGAGATVSLSGTSAATAPVDFSGTYTFTALANGSYTATPAKSGYTFDPTSQNAVIAGTNVTMPSFAATAIPMTISPRRATLTVSANQQFTVGGAGGSVTWSVDGITGGSSTSGTVTPAGLYTPPASAGTHVVAAATADQSANATVYVTNYPGMFTYHNDNQRTGQNLGETVLATTNVNSTQFGKLFSYPTDGVAYASPLYVANVSIPGKGVHDVVYVATAHDSVYAFDAGSPSANPLWKASFLTGAGVTTVPSSDVGDCCNLSPEIGITGTPVIDSASGTIYVVAKTREVTGGITTYVQRLHALDVATGAEKFGGPVVIQATVPGAADDGSGGIVALDPLRENQRPALLLSGGVVYIGFAAHAEAVPWHGWMLGYDATTLQQVMVYNVTANGDGGGIWQSGGGPSADAAGNLYFATGNGTFDATTGGVDFGDSLLKLNTAGAVVDYFTPHDQADMRLNGLDLGSAAPVLLPDQSAGPVPHLLISAGKGGTIYVINRDNMGHYNATNDNQIVQSLTAAFPSGGVDDGNFSSPVYFNGSVYFGAVNDRLKQYQLTNGLLSAAPESQSADIFQNRGGTFALSANGGTNGILWAVQDNGAGTPGVLHAYDASNLAIELYNSTQAGARDSLDSAAKFNVPLVANGKVFIASRGALTVFGILP